MESHLFLDKAYVYPKERGPLTPDEYHYDFAKGFWIHNKTGKPFITSDDHQSLMSKKKDIETGEDEKGE
jgi:GH18 family chitinase